MFVEEPQTEKKRLKIYIKARQRTTYMHGKEDMRTRLEKQREEEISIHLVQRGITRRIMVYELHKYQNKREEAYMRK